MPLCNQKYILQIKGINILKFLFFISFISFIFFPNTMNYSGRPCGEWFSREKTPDKSQKHQYHATEMAIFVWDINPGFIVSCKEHLGHRHT